MAKASRRLNLLDAGFQAIDDAAEAAREAAVDAAARRATAADHLRTSRLIDGFLAILAADDDAQRVTAVALVVDDGTGGVPRHLRGVQRANHVAGR